MYQKTLKVEMKGILEGEERHQDTLKTMLLVLRRMICFCRVLTIATGYQPFLKRTKKLLYHLTMNEEMNSLKENHTFSLTSLPEGKETVGGRWVYTIKERADGQKLYKARYVAKGYSQRKGVDYGETFAPTANMTSVRALVQIATQYDLILHQMDVKTAYLNAPIDFEIYGAT